MALRLLALLLTGILPYASASLILGPVLVDIGTLGEQTPNPLIDAVNMAGINAPGFSVGDNFDAVVANITHDSNSGLYQSDPSGGADPNGWIGFNFGSVFLVERLALWNHNESDS